MIKRHLLLIFSLIFFLSSAYILKSNYITYRQLRGIRANNEINKVIALLDANFPHYYSLPENENNWVQIWESPENHDVDLSEEILEYLNANRNLWQYEYVKNPIKKTDILVSPEVS